MAVDEVRERILQTASDLFYREGARAVGVDLVVERAGVAKTSLYRHFRTKDDLIAAFLAREDAQFWQQWDSVAERHRADAQAELDAHMRWIGERIGRKNYRGCPQLNMAAEFPEAEHPARVIAASHKRELRRRLKGIAERLGVRRPDNLAAQLLLLVNGAFVSGQVIAAEEAVPVLLTSSHALVVAERASR
ncbi:MAG TPA: helix-turn-helix domain-containing protein [Verrucomicrobiae bacterium]|nr:helix-turn-helix domain-containing protein [Verrucomicrobiae bacterium]HTZ54689.1 helix-turn-helix domain-containing protein [Candidatus Acidoferrum sp.]